MSKLIKTPIGNAIEQFVLESGVNLPASPIDICKLGFQIIKDKKEEAFINDVLNSKANVDTSVFKTQKLLERLYKVTQVIAKATTQDKINRFKKLTINGIIYQNEISDDDYELYLNILDNLTDNEFLILSIINKLWPIIRINFNSNQFANYSGEITLSNLDEVIALGRNNDTNIFISEGTLIKILQEATSLQDEIRNYICILYSKGLIESVTTKDRTMRVDKISTLGRKFVEFINK